MVDNDSNLVYPVPDSTDEIIQRTIKGIQKMIRPYENKGDGGFLYDTQNVAMLRPSEQDFSRKATCPLMSGDKYDKASYRPWELLQSKSMNVKCAVQYFPQLSS